MEESEKRRERLKAMRQEAAQAGNQGEAENSMGLANPLIDSQPGIAEPYSRPRFDFYTDPMAAFSADKRKSKHSPQVLQPYSTPPSNCIFFLSWLFFPFLQLIVHSLQAYQMLFFFGGGGGGGSVFNITY